MDSMENFPEIKTVMFLETLKKCLTKAFQKFPSKILAFKNQDEFDGCDERAHIDLGNSDTVGAYT